MASRNNKNRTTEWTTKQRRFAAGKSIEIKNLQKIKRDSSHPDHFFAKKWSTKPSGFTSYRVSGASYILMLDEQSSQAQNVLHTFVCLTRQRRARHKVLHKSLTMKHCSAKAPQYEAASFHSAMKHSLRSYDEKMKNESFSAHSCHKKYFAVSRHNATKPDWRQPPRITTPRRGYAFKIATNATKNRLYPTGGWIVAQGCG